VRGSFGLCGFTSKIDQEDAALGRAADIGGFDVAMDQVVSADILQMD
jgi:hypothetical protein